MATRAKYTRVRQEDKKEDKPDTDIIMRFNPSYGRYISRALTLFFGEDKKFVTIKAADRLMDRALWVAEVIKRRVPGLHQITEIKEREIVDVYEPREQGLVRVQQKRFLTIIEVTLTKEATADQKKAPGYQAPIQGKAQDFLTKEKWQNQETERKDRIANRKDGGDNRGERRDRGERRERDDREGRRDNRDNRDRRDYNRDNNRGGDREGRGGERRRGRN